MSNAAGWRTSNRRRVAASEAIRAGLMAEADWPGRSLCIYPLRAGSPEFGFTVGQVQRIERLRTPAGPPKRAAVLALLSATQRAKLAALERELRLVAAAMTGTDAGSRARRSALPLTSPRGH